MKFLEGKTPAERKKTIAALVLGFLAIVSLSYTFLFSGGSSSRNANNKNAAKVNSNGNAGTVAVNNANANVNATQAAQVQAPQDLRARNAFEDLTPIPENPFLPIYVDQTARNIFAFYEPPAPVQKPAQVAQTPMAIPSPQPTPPILVQYANPTAVYAQQGDFTLEVGGDKFTPDAKVLFNGVEVPTQFQSANRLTAQITAALVSDAGQRQVLVNAPGGKVSNPVFFTVNAPPAPNYNFVGLVARKRFNNDTAMLQDKSTKQYQNVRLGETIGRFKVVSISSREVVMQDTQLNSRHSIAFVDEKSAGRSAGSTTGSRGSDPGFSGGFPQPQNGQMPGMIPGIPSQYTQPQIQPMPQQTETPVDYPDEDDGDNK